jgi:hypothetical protein
VLTGFYTAKDYPDQLRRIKYYDAETDKTFIFLTNNFNLPALTITELYKVSAVKPAPSNPARHGGHFLLVTIIPGETPWPRKSSLQPSPNTGATTSTPGKYQVSHSQSSAG